MASNFKLKKQGNSNTAKQMHDSFCKKNLKMIFDPQFMAKNTFSNLSIVACEKFHDIYEIDMKKNLTSTMTCVMAWRKEKNIECRNWDFMQTQMHFLVCTRTTFQVSHCRFCSFESFQ